MRFYTILLVGLMFIPNLVRADDYTTTQTDQITFDGQNL